MKRFVWFLLLGTLFLSSCQEEVCSFQGQSEEQGIYSSEKEILWMTKTVEESPVTKAVGVKGKYWSSGDTIRIKFLNGTTELQQKVQQYAAEWLEYANLYFKYVGIEEDADVKIGFDLDEVYLAWSTIGTDCRAIPQDQPSLNFVYLDYEDETGIKAEVLRGFGHVLGLGFEHKNPNSTIKFKGTDQQFLDEFNLSGQRLAEFKTLYTTSQTNYTEYDKNSIMTVTIPRSLVTMPPLATSRNTDLSEMDKAFIADLYSAAMITIILETDTYKQLDTYTLCDTSHIRIDYGYGVTEIFETNVYNNFGYHAGTWKIQFFGDSTTYRQFYCNKGTKLDVTKCKGLEELWCWHADLTELDLSKNVKLLGVSCNDNKLTSLDLTHNPALNSVDCRDNRLTELDLSNNLNLTWLRCGHNPLLDLDLSRNNKLDDLECTGTPFALDSIRLQRVISTLPDRTGLTAGVLILGDTTAENWVRSICQKKNWRFTNLSSNSLMYNRFDFYADEKSTFRTGYRDFLDLNRMPARRD